MVTRCPREIIKISGNTFGQTCQHAFKTKKNGIGLLKGRSSTTRVWSLVGPVGGRLGPAFVRGCPGSWAFPVSLKGKEGREARSGPVAWVAPGTGALEDLTLHLQWKRCDTGHSRGLVLTTSTLVRFVPVPFLGVNLYWHFWARWKVNITRQLHRTEHGTRAHARRPSHTHLRSESFLLRLCFLCLDVGNHSSRSACRAHCDRTLLGRGPSARRKTGFGHQPPTSEGCRCRSAEDPQWRGEDAHVAVHPGVPGPCSGQFSGNPDAGCVPRGRTWMGVTGLLF